MARTAGYRILDEIDPVTESSWALHPQMAFYGSMLLDTPYLAALGAVNSYLLGHPRKQQHVAIAVAAVLAVYAVEFVAKGFFPKIAWKYLFLAASAVHLWLGYYLSDEHQWAAEMFEHSGGKVLSFWTTLMLLQALGRIFVLRVQQRWARLFLRLVP